MAETPEEHKTSAGRRRRQAMACGDFIGMYDGGDYIKVPVGRFVRGMFYSGETLLETFSGFEKEYGYLGFEQGEPFNRLAAAAMIRRDWYSLRKLNRLPPGEGCITLDELLDRLPNRQEPVIPAVSRGLDAARAYMALTRQDEIPLDKLAQFVDRAFDNAAGKPARRMGPRLP
jgi:hypothetical protein